MSQIAIRGLALQEANKLGLVSHNTILDAAEAFLSFLVAGEAGEAVNKALPAAKLTAEPKPAAKPTPAAKPKPAAEPKAAPAPAPKTDMDEQDEILEDTVGNVVSRLIKGGKRDNAVALLKKYKATSVSGVKEKNAEAFIAEGLSELHSEQSEGDIES
jgi:biotin carboxyl carrier protein